jgi:hypothetical protein
MGRAISISHSFGSRSGSEAERRHSPRQTIPDGVPKRVRSPCCAYSGPGLRSESKRRPRQSTGWSYRNVRREILPKSRPVSDPEMPKLDQQTSSVKHWWPIEVPAMRTTVINSGAARIVSPVTYPGSMAAYTSARRERLARSPTAGDPDDCLFLQRAQRPRDPGRHRGARLCLYRIPSLQGTRKPRAMRAMRIYHQEVGPGRQAVMSSRRCSCQP